MKLGTGPKLQSERQERKKKAADHSRMAEGRFNKRGDLHVRLALGGHKMSGSPHLL